MRSGGWGHGGTDARDREHQPAATIANGTPRLRIILSTSPVC